MLNFSKLLGGKKAKRSLKDWKQQYVNFQKFTVRFKHNKIKSDVNFLHEINSQINSFTMESLILAQDER